MKGGAELIICPDSTVHEAFEAVSKESPRPWLHIAEIVVQEAVAKKYCRLGLLGTKRLMNGSVYDRVLQRYGLELQLPGEQDQESIDKIIHEELRQGIVSDSSRRSAADIVDQLKQRGCDAVILGCAELPLLITPRDSSLPTLDSAHLLAKGAVRASLRSINDEVFYPHLFLWGRIRIP